MNENVRREKVNRDTKDFVKAVRQQIFGGNGVENILRPGILKEDLPESLHVNLPS